MKQVVASLGRLSPRRLRPAILVFHDVRSREWLESFLAALSRIADVVSLDQLFADGPDASAPRARAALTFDDGCRSIASIVEPVATALGLPLTSFVCGEVLLGGPVPWPDRVQRIADAIGTDRAAALWGWTGGPIESPQGLINRLKELHLDRIRVGLERGESALGADLPPAPIAYLGAEDVRRLAANPLVTFGSHSHRHPILTRLQPSEQVADIEHGLAALEGVTGRRPRWFAYPNGKPSDYDATTIAALRRLGLVGAVTTEQRPLRAAEDPYRLPRLGVSEGEPLARLEFKWALPWWSRGDQREAAVRRLARDRWER